MVNLCLQMHCHPAAGYNLALSVMGKIFLSSLLLFALLTGCRQQSPQEELTQFQTDLSPDFCAEFDRLFLSQEPLRYQDNVAFLRSIQAKELSLTERELVGAKLKQFLAARIENREYAPDSEHTGVASEIAFLRLQAVQILAEVGTQRDADFIQHLDRNAETEHPRFHEECEKAFRKLKDK